MDRRGCSGRSRSAAVFQEREVVRLGGGRPGPVDVRIVAATNSDLRDRIAAGRLREDLFYRLDVLSIVTPPLRQRVEDVPLLAQASSRRLRRSSGAPTCRSETTQSRRCRHVRGPVTCVYDAASLGQLSKATGLGRSSLYHYFPGGKEEMARAVFDRVDEWSRTALFAPMLASGTPQQRLDEVIAALDGYYAGGAEACLFGYLVVGEARDLFQDRLGTAFRKLMDGLARLARKKGRAQSRCAAARGRCRGADPGRADPLARGLDDPSPFGRVLKRLPQDMLA